MNKRIKKIEEEIETWEYYLKKDDNPNILREINLLKEEKAYLMEEENK